jgi:hypothetical protein
MLMRRFICQRSLTERLSCRQRLLLTQIGNKRSYTFINKNVYLPSGILDQKFHGSMSWRRGWHGEFQKCFFQSQQLMLLSANKNNSSDVLPFMHDVYEDEIAMTYEKVMKLCDETERVCNRTLKDELASQSQILHLIEKLYAASCMFSIPKISRKRTRSNDAVTFLEIPHDSIQSISSMKICCAESIDRLLKYHMSYHLGVNDDGSRKSSLFDISSKSEPNTKPFAFAMEAWKETRVPHSGKKAADILQCWGELYGGDINHSPTVAEFNIVLETFTNCSSDDYSSFERGSFPAELAWELYTLLSQLDDPFLIPNIDSCSHLIRALSNHAFVVRYSTKSFDTCMDSDVSAIRAYFIWKKMLDMISSKSDPSEIEVELAWRAHMDILNMSSDGMLRREDSDHNMENKLGLNIGKYTEELLVRLLQVPHIYTKNDRIRHYISQAFSSAMIAWTKEQNVLIRNSENDRDVSFQILQAARSVVALLEVMKGQGLLPEPKHYDSCIKAYANCLNKDTLPFYDTNIARGLLPEVRKLLSDMEIDHVDSMINRQLDGASISTQDKIPASIYTTVIDCYYRNLKSGLGHGNDHKNAARVLDTMLDLYERDLLWIETGHKALTFALNRVLQMISETRPCSDDVSRATKLITRFRSLPNMCSGTDSKVYSPKLDSVSFGAYLTLLSRSDSKDSSFEVANVLDIMEKEQMKLENIHRIAAIKGLRKGGNGELKIRAKKLLFDAIREFSELSIHDQDSADFNAAALYTSMISPTKSSEAISLLGSLQKQYDETMNPKFKPDYPLYCKVLQSISIDKKTAPWKDEKAFEILGHIEEAYMNGDNEMMPNKFCMSPIMNILRRSQSSNAPEIALQLLERMDELYAKSGNIKARPDVAVFCAVMNVLAFSEFPSKAKKVWNLHETMEKRHNDGTLSGQPSFESLSIALDACANSFGHDEREEAASIALRVAKRAATKAIAGEPNTIFYNKLIKSFGVLLSDESQRRQREDLISAVFKQCCEEGLLDDKILVSIRDFFPQLYKKLPGVKKGMSSELPHNWSRNCRRSEKGKSKI